MPKHELPPEERDHIMRTGKTTSSFRVWGDGLNPWQRRRKARFFKSWQAPPPDFQPRPGGPSVPGSPAKGAPAAGGKKRR